MKNPRILFWLILLLTIAGAIIDLPKKLPLRINLWGLSFEKNLERPQIDFSLGPLRIKRDAQIKFGLDLQGGAHLVLEAEMSEVDLNDREAALESTKSIIERRINFFGVSESVIQTSKTADKYRIIVELPGVTDVNEAIDLIGKTAVLQFRESEATPSADLETATDSAALIYGPFTKLTELSGKHLRRSTVVFDPQTGSPQVSLEFSEEGAELFAAITKRNINKQLAIFLDEMILSAPRVNEPISGGRAVISGSFSVEQAKKLSIQLNAGALPVPVKIVEQRNVGATLGHESVRKSLLAGFIGLSLVMFFMWFYYGRLGFLANLGLIIYGIITLALYKLIPVILTLPGLAGLILSIGMAVDANILIFERLKEELRAGRPKKIALEVSFGRAWDSIRDANVCTLITSFILFNPLNWSFLNASGMVRGFALTLALGILISLFTGIVVTRTLMRLFYR